MNKYTNFKVFIAFFAAFTAISAVSTASAAVYYDQLGQAHYYDTYEVPCGQYYPATGCGTTAYGYNTASYGYGYNTGASYYPNRQPVIFSSPIREAIDGQSYVAGINASDPDHDQITYALVSGPSGMYIDANTGMLRWNQTSGKAGRNFTVTVSATDGRTAPVTQTFTIAVRAYGVNGLSTGSSSNTSSGGAGSKSTGYTGSIFSSLFGGSSASKDIVISNVNVVSGPKNINDTSVANCNVYVSWSTNVPTAGQVVYGPTSQQNVANYAYPQSSPEGNAYAKEHQVKLGCLGDATAFFRIVTFSSTDRAASAEYTVFPIKIATQIPDSVNYSGSAVSTISDSNSIWSQFLKFIFNPLVIIVLLIVVIWFVALRTLKYFNGKAKRVKDAQAAATAAAHAPAPAHGPSAEIPMLQVPH